VGINQISQRLEDSMPENMYWVDFFTVEVWHDMLKCQAACPVLADARISVTAEARGVLGYWLGFTLKAKKGTNRVKNPIGALKLKIFHVKYKSTKQLLLNSLLWNILKI